MLYILKDYCQTICRDSDWVHPDEYNDANKLAVDFEYSRTNYDTAIDEANGKFTAPISGIYEFNWHMISVIKRSLQMFKLCFIQSQCSWCFNLLPVNISLFIAQIWNWPDEALSKIGHEFSAITIEVNLLNQNWFPKLISLIEKKREKDSVGFWHR